MRWLFAVVLPLWAASACAVHDLDASDVREERRAWRALGVSDYAFVYLQMFFGDIGDWNGMRVEVQAGEVTNVYSMSTGVSMPSASYGKTLDALYEYVLSGLARDPQEFEIELDRENHYVDRFEMDVDLDSIDDEYWLAVPCFSRNVTAGCPTNTLTLAQCKARRGVSTPLWSDYPSETCPPRVGLRGTLGRIVGTEEVCCLETL